MNILLCGKNSYVGTSLMNNLKGVFNFSELDMRTADWEKYNFSNYDTIIYLAAIVHRTDIKNSKIYKEVNEELPVKVAEIAVKQGVRQFIFFSSMAVYGITPSLSGKGKISANTSLNPKSLYGKSKLNAEIKLKDLQKKYYFNLIIFRPPNIYGEKCPGNYYKYLKFCAKYLIFFPFLRNNQFSMIHIDNLSKEIKIQILKGMNCLVCPQDPGEKSNTVRIAQLAKENNWLHYQSKFLGKVLNLINKILLIKQITSLFGDMYYDNTLNESVLLSKINYPSLIEY